ncbi:MAG: protein kinase domain-containing protein [Thermoanaerobaculia bacterium]
METANGLPAKVGKYEILGVIGRGGMGVVYGARDPYIDRIVAIKTIRIAESDNPDDDQLGRLRMEARSAGKLHHPNIVTIFDFGEEGDLSYIVMEFVKGTNLSLVIEKKMALPLSVKLDLVLQVARGLAYAHECGVVHRDMKPSNICVTVRGVAKLLDFGLARFDNTRLTKAGYLSGTIAYMSPERFSGETGPQDDIFAAGAVAYELFTYHRAFPGESTPEIIAKILGGPMPKPISDETGYPKGLDAIILRALERDPMSRYNSAAALLTALEAFARSDEYQQFIAQERQQAEFREPLEWPDDTAKSTSANPYSSGRSLSSVPIGGSPTLHLPGENAPASGTDIHVKSEDPTLLRTRPGGVRQTTRSLPTSPAIDPNAGEGAATEIMAAQPPRKNKALIPIGAALVVAMIVAGVLLWPKKDQTTLPPPVVTDTALRQSEMKYATAMSLADRVSERKDQLNAAEKTRFDDASKQLERARASIDKKDYAAGTALATDAATTLSELLNTKKVEQKPPPDQGKSSDTKGGRQRSTDTHTKDKKAGTSTATGTVPQTDTGDKPIVITEPPPPPITHTTETVAPVRPTAAELEREVRGFMLQVANAFQDKDVAFFRKHQDNFSDQLANALQNSPSNRVTIDVQKVRLAGETATVEVLRTDTIEAAKKPLEVQLVFELRRTPEGWKIAGTPKRKT